MYPFEWELPTVPFLWSDPDNPNYNLFPLINNMMSNIIGIHESAYLDMKMTAADDPDEINRIMIVDLRGAYCNSPDAEDCGGTGVECCIKQNNKMSTANIHQAATYSNRNHGFNQGGGFRSSMIIEND